MMIDVFISYETTTGEDYAKWLKRALEKAGYKCFLAEESIRKGRKWRKERDKALKECKYFVVIITANTMISKEVMKEYQKAKRLKKQIIPCRHERIRVEDTGEFSRLQQIEFGDKSELAHIVVLEINERER